MSSRLLRAALAAITALAFGVSAQDAEIEVMPDLKVTFTSTASGQSDVVASPDVSLYVPAGESPSAFLPGGAFTAVWEGFISVDLRDRYTMQAKLNGKVVVELDGNVVLEAESDGGISEPSRRLRINQGNNPVKVTYTSPAKGDAMFQLLWSSPDFDYEPIANRNLVHAKDDAALSESGKLRLGRLLVGEHRCQKCHTGLEAEGMLELQMDAPTFEKIGQRRDFAWLKQWVLDPHKLRPVARMPRMLHGANSEAEAAAIATYLAMQDGDEWAAEPADEKSIAAGKSLFGSLLCASCHIVPGSNEENPVKISLAFVNQKFAPGALARFLQKPEEHYEWIRMPNFRLTESEAAKLAAYLRSIAEPGEKAGPLDAINLAKGRALVMTKGCLNCHSGEAENKFATDKLAKLDGANLNAGCLADKPAGDAPDYQFAAIQRESLRAFLSHQGAQDSLKRHVPVEFARRQTDVLSCKNCHGQHEGFPKLEGLGAKLKPEWAEKFIAGEIDYKPRTWIPARMPAFAKRAHGLATGMSMEHGLAPVTPDAGPIDMDLAKVGHKMVGTDGGFSCVACHAIGEFGATQVFESAGVNLAYSGERLQKSFFDQWLLNPLRVDPGTKMPVYFSGGQSPLFEFYEGDAKKQIDAFWEYIRQGDKMPLPTQ